MSGPRVQPREVDDRGIADRLVTYADALAAVCFVGTSGLSLALADPDVRCSLTSGVPQVVAGISYSRAPANALGAMLDRVLADAVLVAHLAFILFVVLGGFLALRWSWAPALHLPAALWGVFIELTGGVCPLTPLENVLRKAAGAEGYSGGFIEHYLVSLIYPEELSRPLQQVLATALVAVNLGVYASVWRRLRRGRLAA